MERKTAHESSDFNRSITCPGETIPYLSKPVLCLDGENMDMDKRVYSDNDYININAHNSNISVSKKGLDINIKGICNVNKGSDDIIKSYSHKNTAKFNLLPVIKD